MTISPPGGLPPEIIEDKVNDWLEGAGTMNVVEWRRMMAYMLRDIRSDVKAYAKKQDALSVEVDALQKKNILMMLDRHPKLTRTLVTSFLLSYTALILTHLDEIIPMIEHALGLLAKIV